MAEPQTKWLADFDVLSNFTTPKEMPTLSYKHPEGLYEAHVSREPDQDADHTLKLRLIMDAADLHDVPDLAEEHANKFLHALAFLTQGSFKILRLQKVIDWTPGLGMRNMLIYSYQPQDKVIAQLIPDFLTSIERLHQSGVSELTASALRWFSAGVRTDRMEDQFQYFWFVVELAASADSENEKVADKCQKCRSDLFCPQCNEISKHRPFQTQRIRAVLQKVGMPENLIATLFEARNRLMHGATREKLEEFAEATFPERGFKQVVDTMGKAARQTIATTLALEKIPEGLLFAEMTTYVSGRLSVAAHVQTVLPGGSRELSFDQIDKIGVHVGFTREPREKPDTKKAD